MNERWNDTDLVSDTSAGDWIEETLKDYAKTSVGSLVPNVFDDYVRILHPAESVGRDGHTQWLRWSDVAQATGHVTHASVEYSKLLQGKPRGFMFSDPPAVASPAIPWEYQIRKMSEILRKFTASGDECFFGFWEGNTAFASISKAIPKIDIRSEKYYLIKGEIDGADRTFRGLRPNIWWPADRAWFVSSHFDFSSDYIGGSPDCIGELLDCADLEAWQVTAQQTITSDSDVMN